MLLEGKTGVVLGLANRRSLAWHIAAAAHAQGARVELGVANERFQEKGAPLAEELGAGLPVICDVTRDESIQEACEEFGRRLEGLDFLVHSIAFADRKDLEGRFVQTSRQGFQLALDISAYSFPAVVRFAEPLLREGASLLTLTYLGAERAVPNYNVMGVAKAALEASVRYLAADLGPQGMRVNAISAGPIKTLSASAVKGVQQKIDLQARMVPLRRNLSGVDVGGAAVFLLSDLASGVTGEILHVDNGYHMLGAWPVES